MSYIGRIGLRVFQGLALCLALVSGLTILTVAWLMYRYDIRLLSVQTGSMQPSLKVGDGLISKPVDFEDLALGEIVNYRTGSGSTVSHRVISLDSHQRKVVTKGDDNKEPDGQVAAAQIISQPLAIVPHAGSMISLLQRPLGLIGLVYIPATVILAREISHFNSQRHRLYRLEI